MKVFAIAKNYVHRIPEGHTNIAINLIESLKVSGLEPTIFTVEPMTVETNLRNVKQFPMLPIPNKTLWNLAFRTRLHDAYAGMKMISTELDCDILHFLNVSAWVYTSILNVFKRGDRSTVAHLWYHNKLAGSIFWLHELRLLWKFFDKIVVTSKYLADYYRTFLGRKVVQVPIPVDTKRFKLREIFRARKFMRLPQDETIIGYIGFPSRYRGVFDLLEAFRHVKDAKLVMALPYIDAGDVFNAYLKKLRSRVITLGPMTHPEIFYNTVDVLVLPFKIPYIFTDPPLTVLEALSSGTPLITTPFGGIGEFTEHEYNAIHVIPNPKEIANAIHRLIRDEGLRNELSRNSRASVMKLSLKNVGEQLLAVYEDLCGHVVP